MREYAGFTRTGLSYVCVFCCFVLFGTPPEPADAVADAVGAPPEPAAASEPPWWGLRLTSAGAAAGGAADGAAADAGGVADAEDDREAFEPIFKKQEGPDLRSFEEIASQEAWEAHLRELSATRHRLEVLRRKEKEAADAAAAQRAADEAASEAEAWRLWRLKAGAA